MEKKAAVITGITGQDGAYLADLLLKKGYTVYGTYRQSSSMNFWRLAYLGVDKHENLNLVEHDLADMSSAIRLIEQCQPDEVYNFAAQSLVGATFGLPLSTLEITGSGAVCLLEAIRTVKKSARYYQASMSEMFGKAQAVPQDEKTNFHPRSPYGCAKLYAHWMTVNYCENHDIFGCSGILYNHESPLRGLEFVTRKITNAIARIKLGRQDRLELGNLSAVRDWGYAPEYVEGMWRMLQADEPDTYVLATGRMETVRRFVEMAAKAADLELEWRGTGLQETGVCARTGRTLVKVSSEFYRPDEAVPLVGSSAKAKEKLGWEAKTSLEELCKMMVNADLRRVASGISF